MSRPTLTVNGEPFDPDSPAFDLKQALWYATWALEQIDEKTNRYIDGETKRIVMGAQELSHLADTISQSIEYIKSAQELIT